MKKLGLALSGGGFRASLYHLGLLRFLRDAGLLSQVTHITSVSGGSVMAAHLVLNWDRYTGEAREFDAAAAEVLAFINLDVRNRITRRFPLLLPLRGPRRLLGYSNRQLTRTGLLEYHYERYLYGDKSLFELPEKPLLHLLATNVSEGCLCSFSRNGLLMVRRNGSGSPRLERVHVGLATIAMAVTASSAFPGFFPPLELTGAEVGATGGEFGRQAYTDGGVFDNLGVRMFHYLKRPLLAEGPLCREDFVDFEATIGALREASKSPEETPLRRLAQILVAACRQPDLPLLANGGNSGDGSNPVLVGAKQPGSLVPLPASSPAGISDNESVLLAGLWSVLHQYQFRLDPVFGGLKPQEPEAENLLRASRTKGRALNAVDQLWLNRHLLEAAFRQATGRPCFRRVNSGLDGVLVSDVGKRIEIQSGRRAGGVIRTALRATDIVMDRVWQLELEKFHDAPGFVFAPITEVVEPNEDPTALHPEVQHQLGAIRTDLDRFSPLEVSGLVRHGYGVCRKVCRANPDLFGDTLPDTPPWDPVPAPRPPVVNVPGLLNLDRSPKAPVAATTDARTLQASATRRIWSTLLDYRDWVSYIYVPIIIPILVVLPLVSIRIYKHNHRFNQLVNSFSQGTRDLETLSEILESEPTAWTGEHPERVRTLDEPDLKGFQILQDSRIFDLRAWEPGPSSGAGADSLITLRRRMKVIRERENTQNSVFRLTLLPTSPKTQVRFPPQRLQPRIRVADLDSLVPGQERWRWETDFDFQAVPVMDIVELRLEEQSPGLYLSNGANGCALSFAVHAVTGELTTWILMPRGKEYHDFCVTRYQKGKPETREGFKPVTEYMSEDSTILAFKLVALEPGWIYDVTWDYR